MHRSLLLTLVIGCSAGRDDARVDLANDTGAAEAAADLGVVVDAPEGFDVPATKKPLDPSKDNDGDGFLYADDCDDTRRDVNPGAFEVPGNGVDDDCNGKVDETSCDDADIPLDTTDAYALANAIGLCQRTKEGERRWGLLEARVLRVDGTAGVDRVQHGVLAGFGPGLAPRAGKKLLALSSGTARLPGQPGFITPRVPSYVGKSEVTPPPGFPRNTLGCDEPSAKTANDSVELRLKIRVPTNATGLRFAFDFYSSEYIAWVCSEYNDTFVTLLETGAKLDPKHAGNVCFDAKGNPVNVNSGFFEACTPGVSDKTTFPCARGTKELVGSGFFDPLEPRQGGATGWLVTAAPVLPGETITLRFAIWDTGGNPADDDSTVGDHILDSTVLLDDFAWTVGTPGTAPITNRPK